MSPRRCSDDWSDRVDVEAFNLSSVCLFTNQSILRGGGGFGGGGGDLPLTSDRRLGEKVKWNQGATSGSPEWKTAERRREGRCRLANKTGTLFPTTATKTQPNHRRLRLLGA